jgi:acyl-CoA thioester hydrolase
MTATHEIRVYFEDTDFTGRVYHGAFVRFLERGRTEMLRAAGFDHSALMAREKPVYFTIRGLEIAFRGPAVIDDLLTVVSSPAESGRATLVVDQAITRASETLVTARVELCFIDGAGRPVRPPQDIRAALVPQHDGRGPP